MAAIGYHITAPYGTPHILINTDRLVIWQADTVS